METQKPIGALVTSQATASEGRVFSTPAIPIFLGMKEYIVIDTNGDIVLDSLGRGSTMGPCIRADLSAAGVGEAVGGAAEEL